MNQFTTDFVQALVQKEDVTKIFRSHLEKYDRIGFNTGNSRNGSYERTLHTEFGELHLVIPRDRNDRRWLLIKEPMIRLKRLSFICSKRV